MTNADLNKKMAEFMWWFEMKKCEHMRPLPNPCYGENDGEVFYIHHNFNPAESISDAWMVVEKIPVEKMWTFINALASRYRKPGHNFAEKDLTWALLRDKDAPLAICKAVEKVMEGK